MLRKGTRRFGEGKFDIQIFYAVPLHIMVLLNLQEVILGLVHLF
jgi:hypothetical protein